MQEIATGLPASTRYAASGLLELLSDVHQRSISGTLLIDATTPVGVIQRACVFKAGRLTYAGISVPEPQEFVDELARYCQVRSIDVVRKFATTKGSVRALLETLVQVKMLTWEDLEKAMSRRIVQVLETLWTSPGRVEFSPQVDIDIAYGAAAEGLSTQYLIQQVEQRRQTWATVREQISSIQAIPQLTVGALDSIQEPKSKQHLQKWVNGQRSLSEIAALLRRDPLDVAKVYCHFLRRGWVHFGQRIDESSALSSSGTPIRASATNVSSNELVTILSVDDSPIAQALIKRTLGDRFNLLQSNDALDALAKLNQNNVSLLLLDLTMPDIDGLQFCRTIRKIEKFKEIPIVMLTARDGLIDKVRGRLAGTNHYLTKPVEPEALLHVIGQYLVADD
ncbi:MAG: response regulator [Cyanobacteria bacterium P01_H01_bin.15]